MTIVLMVLLIAAIVLGPSLWTKWVLARHDGDRPDLPGTGGELARHLVERFGLSGVAVECTEAGSHYDPAAKAVRLEPRFHDGRSISAVAAAAHEVGHALQDFDSYAPLRLRQVLIRNTAWADRVALFALYAAPVVGMLARHPGLAAAALGISVLALGVRFIVHLVTLPVEVDASFRRALPVLADGRYLDPRDLPAARAVLLACAFTYVASALVASFNLFRLIRWLR